MASLVKALEPLDKFNPPIELRALIPKYDEKSSVADLNKSTSWEILPILQAFLSVGQGRASSYDEWNKAIAPLKEIYRPLRIAITPVEKRKFPLGWFISADSRHAIEGEIREQVNEEGADLDIMK
jgi:hypothetical protein